MAISKPTKAVKHENPESSVTEKDGAGVIDTVAGMISTLVWAKVWNVYSPPPTNSLHVG
jgi:hypothetical protein